MFGGTIRPESRSPIKLILIETEFQQAIATRKSDLEGIFQQRLRKSLANAVLGGKGKPLGGFCLTLADCRADGNEVAMKSEGIVGGAIGRFCLTPLKPPTLGKSPPLPIFKLWKSLWVL